MGFAVDQRLTFAATPALQALLGRVGIIDAVV
jgi:hypothetical protein